MSVRAAMLLSMRSDPASMTMSRNLYGGALATILLIVPDAAHAAAGLDGATLRWPWALPFVGILITIATGPLLFKRFWQSTARRPRSPLSCMPYSPNT